MKHNFGLSLLHSRSNLKSGFLKCKVVLSVLDSLFEQSIQICEWVTWVIMVIVEWARWEFRGTEWEGNVKDADF